MLLTARTLAPTVVPTPTLIGIAIVGIVALTAWRVPSLVVVALGGGLGLAFL